MSNYSEGRWAVFKRADQLRPGDRIIFADKLGGEGQVLTVEGTASYFGTLEIAVEEEDYTIDVQTTTMIEVESNE